MDKQTRFGIISAMKQSYCIVDLCQIAEVSRAGYYKWRSTLEQRNLRIHLDSDIKEHILAIHRLHPHYGYIRMRTALRKEGFTVNHKKVRTLKPRNYL